MASGGTTLPTPVRWPGTQGSGTVRFGIGADVAALVFCFVLYTNLAVVATEFHGVSKVIASSITLLLLFPIGKYVVLERQPLVITPVLPLVFAFLGALFLSATLSNEPVVSGRAVVTYVTEGLILYLLVSNAVRTTRTLNRVAWVLILAGSLLGAISLYQELTHTYANNYGGLAQVDQLDTGGGFNIAPEESDEKVLRPRLGGPLGSENRYAQIMVVLLPLALIRVFREQSRRLRLLATGASLLILGGLLLTFSRGAAVALGVILLLMAVLRELRVRQIVDTPRRRHGSRRPGDPRLRHSPELAPGRDRDLDHRREWLPGQCGSRTGDREPRGLEHVPRQSPHRRRPRRLLPANTRRSTPIVSASGISRTIVELTASISRWRRIPDSSDSAPSSSWCSPPLGTCIAMPGTGEIGIGSDRSWRARSSSPCSATWRPRSSSTSRISASSGLS